MHVSVAVRLSQADEMAECRMITIMHATHIHTYLFCMHDYVYKKVHTLSVEIFPSNIHAKDTYIHLFMRTVL